MTDGLEFDGNQFLLYKDQSTCTGGPDSKGVRQTTPSVNLGECDGECIFTITLNNVSIVH